MLMMQDYLCLKILPVSRTPSNYIQAPIFFVFSDTTGGKSLAVRNNYIIFNKDEIFTL